MHRIHQLPVKLLSIFLKGVPHQRIALSASHVKSTYCDHRHSNKSISLLT